MLLVWTRRFHGEARGARAVGARPRRACRAATSLAALALSLLLAPRAFAAVSGAGTATIDGTVDEEEWSGAARIPITVEVPEGTTAGTLLLMNDGQNLYVAVEFVRPVVDPGNSLSVELDANLSGVLDSGDDDVTYAVELDRCFDAYRFLTAEDVLVSLEDIGGGGSLDCEAAFANDGVSSAYEISHPLSSGDVHDISVAAGDSVGVLISLRIIDGKGVIHDSQHPGLGFITYQVGGAPPIQGSYDQLKSFYLEATSAFTGTGADLFHFTRPLVKTTFQGVITADPGLAIEGFNEFATISVPEALASGQLTPAKAETLIGGAKASIAAISERIAAPECDSPPVGTTVYVDAAAGPGGKGNQLAPYQSLLDGLMHPSAGPLTVRVAGRKTESYSVGAVTLSRSVTIEPWPERSLVSISIVDSSLWANGPYRLEVSGVRWSGSSATAAAAVRGSAGARLCLHDLEIKHAGNHAILIEGSLSGLVARFVTVKDTTSRPPGIGPGGTVVPSPVESGTAIVARSGAFATLGAVALQDNDGGGVLAIDSGTTAELTLVSAKGTRVNPYRGSPDGDCFRQGGIVGREDASLELFAVGLYDGMGFGLVSTEGAAIHGELVYVTGTRSAAAVWGSASPAGHGIVVSCGGQTELDGFSSSNNNLCGLMVASYGAPSGLDLVGGVVSNNVVGACINVLGFDVRRITDRVFYRDNETNLESLSLPVPDPTPPSDPIP